MRSTDVSLSNKIIRGPSESPPRILVYGPPGVGKAQPVTEPVLTPTGFVPIGQVRVGDQVIGGDGKACEVLEVIPQGERPVYRVGFSDGTYTHCCDDHLWRVLMYPAGRISDFDWAVAPLRFIREAMSQGVTVQVPVNPPVEFAPVREPLPIDPWAMGFMLGDGYLGPSLAVTNTEGDLQRRFMSRMVAAGDAVKLGRGGSMWVSARVRGWHTPSLHMQAVRRLGLEGKRGHEKFIPPVYLTASMEARLELLRGLIDSDGCVIGHGRFQFSTASERLGNDFAWLARSLGIRVTQSRKAGSYIDPKSGERVQCRDTHQFHCVAPAGMLPFTSLKHQRRWQERVKRVSKYIIKVEPAGVSECVCIRVDHPDGLYLTRDFVVTHNSSLAMQTPNPVFIDTEDGIGTLDVCKFPLAQTYEEVREALVELKTESHDFRTVVIDSLDWLERLIWAKVCQDTNAKNIEQAGGGYARGYILALTYWQAIIDLLNELRLRRRMMAFLIAHAKVEKFEDPEGPAYDRYIPRLNKHACGLVTEWCDAVLFATRRIRTYSEDAGFGRKRTTAHAIGKEGSERVLRTIASPSCLAKNRYGLAELIPMNWQSVMEGITQTIQRKEKTNG